jgi:hypothetical protein
MGQVYAIFRNTLLETVRQPVYGLVLAVTCTLITATPSFAAQIYTFRAGSGYERSAERMVADLGIATVLLAGLILAVFATSGVVNREIEEKTALTVLSKRISRGAFILGKYLGVSAAISLAALAGTMTVLFVVRMKAPVTVAEHIDWRILSTILGAAGVALGAATFRNYTRGRAWIGSFNLTFIALLALGFLVFSFFDQHYVPVFMELPEQQHLDIYGNVIARETFDWEVGRAAFLTLMAVLVISGVAVAASTRLRTGGNFLVSALVFAGGLTSEYVTGPWLGRPLLEDPWPGIPARIWHALLPNLQHHWMSDALTREVHIPWSYVGQATLYSILYIGAMLFVAAFLFERREVT